MTYARARLWLGISGVGSLVVISVLALAFAVPSSVLATGQQFSWLALVQITSVAVVLNLWMTPFDLLGGYFLPGKFGKSEETFSQWISNYSIAVIGQSTLFIGFATTMLIAGQAYGLVGSLTAISGGVLVCLSIRNYLMQRRQIDSDWTTSKFVDALELVQSWKVFVPKTMVVKHRDVGFTGGIIGFGNAARIVIPKSWLQSMPKQQLATAIARRAIAINSGSYSRGLAVAFLWNVIGFVLCSSLPAAGLTSVSALVTTFCWFTLWSFVGLLVLPTVSRNASLHIDQILIQQGTPIDLILDTAFSLDGMQDGEPERSKLIETIFHPVPSVSNRNQAPSTSTICAWNVARTTLFLSWPCFGVLSRAVHCNVGRPELWTMLPTD